MTLLSGPSTITGKLVAKLPKLKSKKRNLLFIVLAALATLTVLICGVFFVVYTLRSINLAHEQLEILKKERDSKENEQIVLNVEYASQRIPSLFFVHKPFREHLGVNGQLYYKDIKIDPNWTPSQMGLRGGDTISLRYP